MGTYLIITCLVCGKPLIAKSEQKTKTCPYCGKRFSVKSAKLLVQVKDARLASVVLRSLKEELAKTSRER